jgi:hypothetical protein
MSALPSPPPASPSLIRGAAFDVLCACATTHPEPAQIALIAGGQPAGFDWEDFLRSAEHHGVLALAVRNLIEHAPALPSEVRRSLESAYAENFRRGLWFTAELQRITRHFALNGVRAIPYKGPTLAQRAYGDLALRSFSDLDLLIAPEDFARARRALAELGYLPSKPLTPAVERLWLRTGYERSFDGPGGKNLVELQWALLPYFYAVDPESFRFDHLWSRAGQINLGTNEALPELPPLGVAMESGMNPSSVPCLSPEDSLLVLSLHAAKHLWTRLIWVADIAESLRASNVDLALVVSRARPLGVARILGVSLQLANHLLQAPLPPAGQALIDHDPQIPELAQEALARLSRGQSYDFETTAYFREILRTRERRADRWRYLWRLVWTPGPGDIEALKLPEMMFPIYPAVRLARLLRRFA